MERKNQDFSFNFVKGFLDKETYLNLRVGVRGFVNYCQYMLDNDLTVYVAMLFNNSSVVESVFASIRTANMDSASMYSIGASSMNLERAVSSVNKGKCYSTDQIGNVIRVGADISLGNPKKADEKRNKHIEHFNSVATIDPTLLASRSTFKFVSSQTQALLIAMTESWSKKWLSAHVLQSKYYQFYVRLTLDTEYQTSFVSVKSMGINGQHKLESFTWKLMIKCLDLSQVSSKRKTVDKFNVSLIKYRYVLFTL